MKDFELIKTLLPLNDKKGTDGASVRTGSLIKPNQLQAIVIHNTFSPNRQTPQDICNYWTRQGHSGASAHCIIQDGKIYECIPFYPREKLEIAHHCGDIWRNNGKFFNLDFNPKSNNLNNNSIGIEIFSVNEVMDNIDIETAAKLTAFLLKSYDFSQYDIETRVVRHYDVTSKKCPAAFCKDEKDDWAWENFLIRVDNHFLSI